jgi:2-polyprenyl-6-methoxyphenol hydroxylase-like FAD-dependent oxidoreductase
MLTMGIKSAIVIGGGIGGLSAALQLRRLGVDVAVFERQAELSEVDTGLSLWAFAVGRLAELGLAEDLARIAKPIDRVVHRGPAGGHLSEVPVSPISGRFGVPSYEVHRSRLQRLLADSLDHNAIRFGRRCVAVQPEAGGVRAEFESGEPVSSDILIGADGVHSTVRDAVAGRTRLRRSPVGVWRGTLAMDQDELATGVHLRFMGPAALFGIARISDELVRWYAGAPYDRQPRSGSEAKQLALDRFAGWASEVVGALERTAPGNYLWNDTPHVRPLRRWGRGGLTLLGDAAHSSLPTLGISAGLAIEDAAVLRESLSASVNEVSGLRAYERRRQRVTSRVVRAAAIFGRVLMIRRQPVYASRQLAVRLAPQSLALRWLVSGGQRRPNKGAAVADAG